MADDFGANLLASSLKTPADIQSQIDASNEANAKTNALNTNTVLSQATAPGALQAQNLANQKEHLNVLSQKNALAAQILSTANDQSTWTAGLQTAAKNGIDTSQIPQQYDPSIQKQLYYSTLTAAQRLNAQHLALDDQMKAQGLQETARHNAADEKGQALGHLASYQGTAGFSADANTVNALRAQAGGVPAAYNAAPKNSMAPDPNAAPVAQSQNLPANTAPAPTAALAQMNMSGLPNGLTKQPLNDWIRQRYGDAIANMVTQRANGDEAAGRGSGIDPKLGSFIEQAAHQQEPQLNQVTNNYANKVATIKSLQSGELYKTTSALGTAAGHLAGALQAAPNVAGNSGSLLNLGQGQLENRVANHFANSAGNPDVTEYNVRTHGLVNEINNAYGHNDDAANAKVAGDIEINNSLPQKVRALGTFQEMMTNKLDEVASTARKSGVKVADPVQLLAPENQQQVYFSRYAIQQYNKNGKLPTMQDWQNAGSPAIQAGAAPAPTKTSAASQANPTGVPTGAKMIGTSGGKPVYQAPNGKKYIQQ